MQRKLNILMNVLIVFSPLIIPLVFVFSMFDRLMRFFERRQKQRIRYKLLKNFNNGNFSQRK